MSSLSMLSSTTTIVILVAEERFFPLGTGTESALKVINKGSVFLALALCYLGKVYHGFLD
jgi:hypothetical protein